MSYVILFFNWLVSKRTITKEENALLALLPEKAASRTRYALQNPERTGLDLSSCKLTNEHIPIILFLLSETKITSLHLKYNWITFDGAKALAKNTTLRSLNLTFNQIGPKGATALAENTTLKSLCLAWNHIGNKGAKALAKNTALIKLELEYNHIGNKGAKAIAKNTVLRELRLNRNDIRNKGAIALAKNTHIKSLDLSENHIGPKGAKKLAKNTTLKSLNLSYNDISDNGAIIALAENTTLESLDLRSIINTYMPAFLTNYTLLSIVTNHDYYHLQRRIASNRKLRTEIRNTAQVLHQLIVQQNEKPHAIDRLTMQNIIQHLLPHDASSAAIKAFDNMATDAIDSYKKVKAETAAKATSNNNQIEITTTTTTSNTVRR